MRVPLHHRDWPDIIHLPALGNHGAQYFQIVQLSETSAPSEVVNIDKVSSVLGLYEAGSLEDQRWNDRSGTDGNLDDIRDLVDGNGP